MMSENEGYEKQEAQQAEPAVPAQDTGADSSVPPQGGKKKWVIPAAVGAVVVVAGVAVAMTMGGSKEDPKDIVLDAFKSITAEGGTNPAEEIFGAGTGEEKSSPSGQATLEFTLEGCSDESVNQLATASLGVTALSDVENRKYALTLGVGYGGMDLASLEAYMDEKQIVAALPELSSKAFTLNYSEDLEGQLASSPYLGAMLSASGMDLAGINDYLDKCMELSESSAGEEGKTLFDLESLWNRYREGSQAIEDLKAAMTVEETEKKSFTIDGSETECDGYHVTISKDDLIQFIDVTKDFFLNDETLKSDFIEYIDMVTEMQGSMGMSVYGSDLEDYSAEELQEELWNTMETESDKLMEELKASVGDVNANVYVRKDGKMAGFDYEFDTVVEEENIKLYGDVSFGGGYSMLSNVKAALHLENGKGETVSVSLDKTGAYEAGKAWTGSLRGALEADGVEYAFQYDGDYQVEDGAYQLSLDFLSGGESQLLISSNGFVNKEEDVLDVVMDSIKAETTLLSGSKDYIELSGKYSAGPLTEEVKAPSGEAFDILAATEEDYNDVMTEISGKVFGLMMKLY